MSNIIITENNFETKNNNNNNSNNDSSVIELEEIIYNDNPCESIEEENSFKSRLRNQSNGEGNISKYWKEKYEKESMKSWDLFYKRYRDTFFQDRHYINRNFPELFHSYKSQSSPLTVSLLEVGCGTGNLFYPVLKQAQHITQAFALDFSSRAIEILKQHQDYDSSRCIPIVHDLTQDSLPQFIQNIDFATLVFFLSAISPSKMPIVLERITQRLRPGAFLFFRDYGIYDMTQFRFKQDSKLSENLYIKWDGTRTYYFQKAILSELLINAGLKICRIFYTKKTILNRKSYIRMKRIWVQAVCTK